MNFQKTLRGLSASLAMMAATSAFAGGTAAPEGAKAYIINLKNGDSVSSPVLVQFGLSGMGVAPAGVQNIENSGHHHLLIDTQVSGEALTKPLPSDARHRHFGKGQTEATLELAPGKHTLQLLLGDWKHTPHKKPVMSDVITITVK